MGKKRVSTKKKTRRHSSKSTFDTWFQGLKRQYQAQWDQSRNRSGKQYRSCLLTYGPSQVIPKRLPNPHGPSEGAMLTVCQQAAQFNNSAGITGTRIDQGSATAINGTCAFRLDDLSQYSTFASLFDQYRIDRVHFRIRPKNTAISNYDASSVNAAVPNIFVVADFDDSSPLSVVSDYLAYGNVVQLSAGDSFDGIIEPAITPAIYSGGAFTGYGVEGSKWIDMASTTIPHYGIKFHVTALNASTTNVWRWDVVAWYQVSFRNVR